MRSVYELWMQQSKDFLDTANKNLKDMFAHGAVDPRENMEQIETWVNAMKQQWQMAQAQHENDRYWTTMTKICSDATDLMLQQWMMMSKSTHPIKNMQQLYELWLNCCHEVYQRSLQSKEFQDVYGEAINAAFRYWKSAAPVD